MSETLAQKNKKMLMRLLFAVVGMFGFGFALVPLYEVFCDITGLNGKTNGRYEADASTFEVDESRLIRVQFVTQNNENMPWEFKPEIAEMKVRPGEMIQVDYRAKNTTSRDMVAQAVPSLSPSKGVDYFHKTECFCFDQQPLASGEEVMMPLVFVVDPALPKDVPVLTLSYTIFDITEDAEPKKEQTVASL